MNDIILFKQYMLSKKANIINDIDNFITEIFDYVDHIFKIKDYKPSINNSDMSCINNNYKNESNVSL